MTTWAWQYANGCFRQTELPPQQHPQNLANSRAEPEAEQEIDEERPKINARPPKVRFAESEGDDQDAEEDRDVPQTSQNLALAGVPAKSVKMQSTSIFIDIEWVPVLPILCAKTSIVATRTAQQCQQEQGSAKSD